MDLADKANSKSVSPQPTLSGFFPENSIRSRRNLRSEIEKRSLVLNEEFLNAFREIKEVSLCIKMKNNQI